MEPSDKVLICVMPFLPVERPALGVSLLKSHLAARHITCDVRYFNHRFADDIGLKLYQQVAQLSPTHDLVGEWIFTKALNKSLARRDDEFADLLRSSTGFHYDEAFIGQIAYARSLASAFIEQVADEIEGYRIVGLSTTFQQNIASLALAQELKRRNPSISIVFGGANCEGEMGIELHRSFPFIDIVCSGEADETFPRVVEAIFAGASLANIPSIIFREGDRSIVASEVQQSVRALDALPYPDHLDFLAAFHASTVPLFMQPELTMETSRGCWWGQKHHCTFCGLNGLTIHYRSKSAERAIAEIRYLRDAYDISTFFMTDNILDVNYFRTVFPELKEEGTQLQLFYEMKANLKKEQLRTLRDMGTTWLQPGIESLNSHVLQIMRKGVQGIQNVQLLKWARELGFIVTWNVLCGFPGERPNDYEELERLIRLIPHLPPPSSFAAFRLDRFSPMHDDPEAFGLKHIRPCPSYAFCYNLSDDQLARLAYFFTYTDAITPETGDAITRAWEVALWWRKNYLNSHLACRVAPDFVLIEDARADRPPRQELLFGKERLVYLVADKIQSVRSATDQLRREHPQYDWNEPMVGAILQQFVESDLMLQEGERFLSLAVLSHADDAEHLLQQPRTVRAPSSWIQ